MKLLIRNLVGAASGIIISAQVIAQPTMTAVVTQQPCNNNGAASVTVAGLSTPISYTYMSWTANSTIVHSGVTTVTDALSGIPAYQPLWGSGNVWNVMASDGSNTAYGSFTINPAFNFSVVDSAGVCPAPSTITAYFSGGTSPYSCLWTNLTNSVVYTTNPATVTNGQYQLVATDGAGCVVSTATGSSNINVWSISGMNLNITSTQANCTNGSASLSVTGGTAPYTYSWSNSASTQNISGLTQGLYSVLVTDNIGCQSLGYVYVSQAVTINYNNTISNATCLQNNGAVTSFVSGGTPPYTYQWSNSATTANLSNVPAGNYQIQITDANGCTGYGSANVNASTPVSVTYMAAPSSCTAATGGATLIPTGGVSPYTAVWYLFPSNTTGLSINAKPTGSYSFKVTDANGCIQTGAAQISPSSTITAVLNNGFGVCPSTNGHLIPSVSGSHPPHTYLWSNSATTPVLANAPFGVYTCTITNAVGCKVVKSAAITQVSHVNITFNTNPVTCLYSANGSATAQASQGPPPFTYTWSNNQNTNVITGLTTGYYWVTAKANNGCMAQKQVYVGNNMSSNACYCTITGTVYADANNNCVRNSGENGVPNVQIHCSGFGYAYTNSNGVYSFQVPTGTYTISESMLPAYPMSTCQANHQVVNVTAAANCVSNVNFANDPIPVSDLYLYAVNLTPAVPGNSYKQRVIVQNMGTNTESNLKLGYLHDGQLSYGSSSNWSFTQQNSTGFPNWYSITSGFPSLSPGGNTHTDLTYNVPTNIPVSTVVNFYDTVAKAAPIGTNWLLDHTPWTNVDQHQAVIVSSYDPNFKEVSPKGVGTNGGIVRADSNLVYAVHFQNTGNYFAQNIVVIDSIDANLRITSLKPGYSDYRYSTEISETGVAKFSFPNINLPYQSAYGDELSSGMFVYSISLKKNLPVGTQIRNKAAIYFDYNEPIITNTTLNTIIQDTTDTGIGEFSWDNTGHGLIFPNPARDQFTLVGEFTESGKGVLTIADVSGRLVSEREVSVFAGQNAFVETSAAFANGIYLVRLESESKVIIKKLVIAR